MVKVIKVDENRKLYYLASVYTKHRVGLEQAYLDACEQGVFLAKNGIYTFGPIAQSHGMTQFDAPNTHEFWLPWDAEFIKRCDGVIVCMMDNWEKSFGIDWEINFAKSIDKPVFYMTPWSLPNLEGEQKAA